MASEAQLIKKDFAAGLTGYESTITRELMVEFLRELDPGLTEVGITRLFDYADKDRTGILEFEKFVDFVCGLEEGPSSPKNKRKESQEAPPLKRGDVVKVARDGPFNGRLATVLEPMWSGTVLDPILVKVQLRGGGADDGNGEETIESFKPSEVSLEKLQEVDLQEQLANLKVAAYKKLDESNAQLEEEQKKRQEAEERAKAAEDRASRAEERAVRAEQALEDDRNLAQLKDGEERQKAEDELKKKREAEEAERSRLAEEEEGKRQAEVLARLKEEDDAAQKHKEEADEVARQRAEAAENQAKALGASRTRIKVTVIRAEGLRAGDIGGLSDPYCTVHLLGQKEDAAHPPFNTDIQKKTLTPVWGQEHTFDACTLTNELLFEVWDHDDGKKDDALGSAILSPLDFRPNGFDDVVILGEKKRMFGKAKEAGGSRLYVKVQVLPMVVIAGMPRCFINFQSAVHLRAADKNGKSDPYCIAEVPGKPMSRFRTVIKKKTLNPEWAEEAEIPEYAQGDDLQLQVFDNDRGSSLGDPLGSVLLKADQIEQGFNGELRLVGKGALLGSKIRVIADAF